MNKIEEVLDAVEACEEAELWVGSQRHQDLYYLYQMCPRADWIILAADKMGVKRPAIIRAAYSCARTTRPLIAEVKEDGPVPDYVTRVALRSFEMCDRNPTYSVCLAVTAHVTSICTHTQPPASDPVDPGHIPAAHFVQKWLASIVRAHLSWKEIKAGLEAH